jgi:radical SAM superfamily enzyme YgiQ (UPF0313 family)
MIIAKKLVVINPVQDGFRRAKRRAFLPPTTLSVIASLTPSDWDVSTLDENIASFDEPGQIDKIEGADLVGISIMTSEAHRGYQIADRARKMGKTVVLGGYHITACPEEALEHADAVVVGRAEAVWEQVVRDFEQGRLQKQYENEKDVRFVNPNLRPQPWLKNAANGDPFPGKYVIQHMTYTTIGCVRRCAYCYNSKRKLPFTARDVADVRKELEALRGSYIAFCDDDIVANKKHGRELFEAIKDLDLKWLAFASMKIGLPENEEYLKLVAEAGCEWLFVGFETFSQDTLDGWGKKCNAPDLYAQIADNIHKAGIKVCSSFVIGAEGEKPEDVLRIADFVDEASPERVDMFMLTPFPGTVLFDSLDEQGKILTKDWSLYDAKHVICVLADPTKEALIEKFRDIGSRVYSWRSILKRTLFDRYWGLFDRIVLFLTQRRRRRIFRDVASRMS